MLSLKRDRGTINHDELMKVVFVEAIVYKVLRMQQICRAALDTTTIDQIVITLKTDLKKDSAGKIEVVLKEINSEKVCSDA
ncbi:MAG: hypothetical protein EZS28_005371 [Streblomastix strix]|uniref:Uncharacterized protein n=1 Tax=Streblomastix strix TaxID=222440 RepID=A0A5J4WX47_9EUKA|nr:MAG: hypothetical protein EZS28_005371 [Streblomastix strix]